MTLDGMMTLKVGDPSLMRKGYVGRWEDADSKVVKQNLKMRRTCLKTVAVYRRQTLKEGYSNNQV